MYAHVALCRAEDGSLYRWQNPHPGKGTYHKLLRMPPEWVGNVTGEEWRKSGGDFEQIKPHLRTGWPYNHYYC